MVLMSFTFLGRKWESYSMVQIGRHYSAISIEPGETRRMVTLNIHKLLSLGIDLFKVSAS